MPIPANATDPGFLAFLKALLDYPICPPKYCQAGNYAGNLNPVPVQLMPNSPYMPDHCWFNALEHRLKNDGAVICGWSFWEVAPNHYVAQHHAVWEDPSGTLLDVTPNSGTNTILFMPHNAAPFDYWDFRCPFNFERDPQYGDRWYASGHSKSPVYAIGQLTFTTQEEKTREEQLRKLTFQCIQDGII